MWNLGENEDSTADSGRGDGSLELPLSSSPAEEVQSRLGCIILDILDEEPFGSSEKVLCHDTNKERRLSGPSTRAWALDAPDSEDDSSDLIPIVWSPDPRQEESALVAPWARPSCSVAKGRLVFLPPSATSWSQARFEHWLYSKFPDDRDDERTEHIYCLCEHPTDDPDKLREAGYNLETTSVPMCYRLKDPEARPLFCIFEFPEYAGHDEVKNRQIVDHIYCTCVKCTAVLQQKATPGERERWLEARTRWIAKARQERAAYLEENVCKMIDECELGFMRDRMVVAMALGLSDQEVSTWNALTKWEEKAREELLRKEYGSLARGLQNEVRVRNRSLNLNYAMLTMTICYCRPNYSSQQWGRGEHIESHSGSEALEEDSTQKHPRIVRVVSSDSDLAEDGPSKSSGKGKTQRYNANKDRPLADPSSHRREQVHAQQKRPSPSVEQTLPLSSVAEDRLVYHNRRISYWRMPESDSESDDERVTEHVYCLSEYPSDDPEELRNAGYNINTLKVSMRYRLKGSPRPLFCIFELSEYASHDSVKYRRIGDHIYRTCVKCTAVLQQKATPRERKWWFEMRARWIAEARQTRASYLEGKISKLTIDFELKLRRPKMVVAMALNLTEHEFQEWEDKGEWQEKARKQVLKEHPDLRG
ncbi:hypothetical protein NMY22_g8118 [Coprinellus aureogranulatus]|nr:hypothetical protein NMY22_g8118 [Coprinellus aureogranulatus]